MKRSTISINPALKQPLLESRKNAFSTVQYEKTVSEEYCRDQDDYNSSQTFLNGNNWWKSSPTSSRNSSVEQSDLEEDVVSVVDDIELNVADSDSDFDDHNKTELNSCKIMRNHTELYTRFLPKQPAIVTKKFSAIRSEDHSMKYRADELPRCINRADELREVKLAAVQPLRSAEKTPAKALQIITDQQRFADEHLKLLHKMIATQSIHSNCQISVDFNNGVVKLTGDNESVCASKLTLLEIATNFCCMSVNLTHNIVKLLFKTKGDKWLQERLSDCKLTAVLFEQGATPCILATDEDDAIQVKRLLESRLTSRILPFSLHHTKYLQSKSWMEAIDKFESALKLLEIHTEYTERQIVLCGSIDTVHDVAVEITDMMRKNSKITKTIPLGATVFKLLKMKQLDIQKEVEQKLNESQDR